MKKPVVSVLIPVYNVEKYLGRCLKSIMKQTLSNIEIICVNDGSTDKSAEILEEYSKKDSRIVIVTKENGGLPSARNAGLDAARGTYVGFVDSDDYIEPRMFEKLVNAARKNSSEVVICGANIFPEKPRADQWLYDTLSPAAGNYKKFDPEVLFERFDTTPFLWRVLIKRELIERDHLRLEEDIVIGEDKAFQCKVYSRAKGISIIPDKLYNYCWYRPGSLMSKQVYGKYVSRVHAHTKLVASIAADLAGQEMKPEKKEDTLKDFTDWSVPFIYDDFIYLPLKDKAALAPKLLEVWKEAGCFKYLRVLAEWKREAFKYISSFKSINAEASAPDISVIVPFDADSVYVEEWIENAVENAGDDIEFIIINNGMSSGNYIKIQKFLYKNPYIRLFNTPKHESYGKSLNTGIDLAAGRYISFMEVSDWYESGKDLSAWLSAAKKTSADICTCTLSLKNLPEDRAYKEIINSGGINPLELDFHDALYKKDFLVKNELAFEDASLMTGYLFFCRALYSKGKVTHFEKPVYVMRNLHHPDWISTGKCEKVLAALEELLDLSLEKKDAALHAKVFSMLNGDLLKRTIVNNTKPYVMPTAQCPEGENSQIKSVIPAFSIISKADLNLLYEAGYTENDHIIDIAFDMVTERQNFLNRGGIDAKTKGSGKTKRQNGRPKKEAQMKTAAVNNE